MDRGQKIKILQLLQSGNISTDFLKTMDRQIFTLWQNLDETGYSTCSPYPFDNMGEDEKQHEHLTNEQYKEFSQKIHHENLIREKIGLEKHLIIQVVRDKQPLPYGKFTT